MGVIFKNGLYPRPKDVEFYSNAQKQASPLLYLSHKNPLFGNLQPKPEKLVKSSKKPVF
jgi:hypothetical protein